MKRGILAGTLIVTLAGVASANLLTTTPQSTRPTTATPLPAAVLPQAQPVVPVAPVIAQAQPTPPVAPTPKPAPTAVVQKSSIEMRQAPVPLLMKPRPAINLPASEVKATDAAATGTKDGETASDQPAEEDVTAEKVAKAAIEADGYKGVKMLRKGANGAWHASALRGRATVMLTVDSNGRVSAD